MHLFVFDGIGTSAVNTSGVTKTFVNRLRSKLPDLKVTWVNWPATMVGLDKRKTSWQEASDKGLELFREHLSKLGDEEEILLLGYSGGCKPVREITYKMPSIRERIVAVGMISDWQRPYAKQIPSLPLPLGYGCGGSDPTAIPDRVFWCSVPGDVITDASKDALVRYLADMSDEVPGRFLKDAREHLRLGTFQLAWQLGLVRKEPLSWFFGLGKRVDQFRQDVEGYFGTKHNADYTKLRSPFLLSYSDNLADTIAWRVKRVKTNG